MTLLQGENWAVWDWDASSDGAAKAMPQVPLPAAKAGSGRGQALDSPLLSGLYLLP